ncbi:MAG: alpha/beta fold hydrolase [Pseudomonadales bacterium]
MARWDKAAPQKTIPDWFFEAVETPATAHKVEVEECDVCYRVWEGDRSRPLLLVHGMNAHSHWWDFIAPQLTPQYHVVALDLTGMGDSDYRYDYSADTFSEEIRAVADAAELSSDVIIAAHSFGGRVALHAAARWPERFGGLILLDSGIRAPDEEELERPPMGGSKLYPSREVAEARFRLQPPQSCENEYILQYIARHSLMPEDGGFVWKFDDDLRDSLQGFDDMEADFQKLAVPLRLFYGADSALYTARSMEYMASLVPAALQPVAITALDNAQHHLFLDQPQAFLQVLRDELEAIGQA